MDSKIICGRILQEFIRKGRAQVEGYNEFKYLRHNDKSVTVLRENGKEASVSFDRLIIGIEGYQANPDDYDVGPAKTRDYGLTHINSPIWSLLHLIEKEVYL